MADSLAGAVDGGVNAIAGTVGIRPLARGPIYGHEEAFANGRVIGQGAVLAGETAVFVSGTMGSGDTIRNSPGVPGTPYLIPPFN